MEDPQFKLPTGSRVLVTGATGFTGSVLVRKLVAQGLDIVAIARPSSKLEPFNDLKVEWIRGDVFDEELIKKAIKGVNYIFHIVTPFREAKSADNVYYNVHVLSTQLLAKYALEEPEFKRFVHVSTIGVHGHVENPPGDENCPMNPGDIYQETKLEGELWIRDFAKKEGLPVTVVRPSGIYGPGEKRFLKIFKMVGRKWIPIIGNGSNLLHLIHVDDLTNFFILSATHPKAVGEVFICGSKEAITFKEMVYIISEYYGISFKFISLPAAPLFALGDFLEFICRPLGIEPPIYRRRLAFYTKDRSFNTAKMINLLGFVPVHSDEEGLKELAQWYLDQGWISL
ncbi:MAG: NAD(P)-dependent oxidoreductase [Moorea sp. SIO4A1]|uniref:NAD-dependent epimerase/dehydratase family protein n=1 Tax=Moorena sp. SIO4A1 TaxID=2607835 RepID=UPI00144C874A|nr:NAD(P)-dependent oxidoreductase [Moorena sp. SIO4A1]NEQ56445.1 NAD(P)-dependent oxidoreductase [Moorena sp. SIO4A1]